MKSRAVFALLVLGCISLSVRALAQTKTHHVLFAVTSPEESDWKLAMGNLNNALNGLGGPDKVEIEVVAFGPGLAILKKDSAVKADIQALEKHVRFVACENSMRIQHVTLPDLAEGVGSVPSGIVEVITKQEQNWSYIKAGR
jgi:intracellular sulfur oxidation DsrE/DsrF family protein